jgi:DNA-binding winged helix-turn-helix (wHTH) protein/tetratricopeptide (TPR) repeat protein
MGLQAMLFRINRCIVDTTAFELRRDDEIVAVQPQVFDLLLLLLENRHRLVTKEEIFQRIWKNRIVSDAALSSRIKTLRQALGDDGTEQGYIRTIRRRGFRLIAPVEALGAAEAASPPASQAAAPIPARPKFVGREAELSLLGALLAKARTGRRQVVFVTGEAGIGKTCLVSAFVSSSAASSQASIGHAQCIELYGTSEPYLPIFEALQRLGAEIGVDKLAIYLKSFAPTWLAQMPWLSDGSQPPADVAGATPQRMLRELAQALEAMSAARPIVLWLEDLHWSDRSTLDAISFLARRSESARLMVIGSYRPAEARARRHPVQAVKEAIALHGVCTELALGFLGLKDVASYLQGRFALEAAELGELAQFIHGRTDGNPLFAVALTDDLVRSGALRHDDGGWRLVEPVSRIGLTIPDTVQILIGQQIENLAAEERRVLQIAAVSGAEFSAAAIAATPGLDIQAVEEICDRLVQREQFITSRGSHDWPDGTVANRYAFVHAMYQEGLSSRVSEARRVEWQGRIAAREEQGYGANVRDIAAQLAVRFEAARQYDRGVKYLELAARNALSGNAYIEAARLFGKAIDMLPLAQLDDPSKVELRMLLPRSVAVVVTQGYATDEIEKIHKRALALARERGDQAAVVRVLHSVWTTYVAQGQLHKARSAAIEISDQAELTSDKTALLQAYAKLGQTSFHLGELAMARAYFENALAISADMPDEERARVAGYLAWTLWYLGFPDAACRMGHESLQLARALKGHYGLVFALGFAGWVHSFRGELPEAEALVDEGFEMSSEYGLPFWITWSSCLKGLIQSKRGDYEAGLARMQQSVVGYRATGARIGLVHFMTELAETAMAAGDYGLGLATIEEAREICANTGNRYHAADTHRVQGELLIAANRAEEGELRLLHSLNVARSQGARSLELRTLISLAKRSPDWLIQLKATRDGFTEGLDTLDLRRADEVLTRV